MKKEEFIANLKAELNILPQRDLDERLNFYMEMIDDKIENGTLEEDAVKEIGPVKIIASQIIEDYKANKKEEKSIKLKRKLKTWEIVLVSLGSPIWFSLLVAVASVIFSVYVSAVAVVFSLFVTAIVVLTVVTWACFCTFAGCSVGGILTGIVLLIQGNVSSGLGFIGSGIVLIGLAIFTFYLSKVSTVFALKKLPKLVIKLAKSTTNMVKRIFFKKEKVQ